MERIASGVFIDGRDGDRRLVAEVLAGDDAAFTSLFHLYRSDVFGVASAVTGDRESALDAVQETFLKVHRSLRSWKGAASLRTWIVRIAVRSAIDIRRKRPRREVTSQDTIEPAHDPRLEMDGALLRARLESLAERLDGQQGLILRLRLFAEISNKEIAAELGLTEPNVRMQLSKALKRLRELV